MSCRVQNQRDGQSGGPEKVTDAAEPWAAARVSITHLLILALGKEQRDAHCSSSPQLSHPIHEMNIYEDGEKGGEGMATCTTTSKPSGRASLPTDRRRLCSQASCGHTQMLLVMARRSGRYGPLSHSSLRMDNNKNKHSWLRGGFQEDGVSNQDSVFPGPLLLHGDHRLDVRRLGVVGRFYFF
jgi:hypothetical protein